MKTVSVDMKNMSPYFKKSIDSIIKRKGFLQCEIEIQQIDTEYGNFLGSLYEVNIKGVTNECKKDINIFIKEEVVLEKIKLLNIKDIYSKEIFIYKNFANVANKLQIEANVPECERYKFAKMYDETADGLIILENLSKHGFKTYYRMDVMPIKYAELSIVQLAKFHALSLAIESIMPDYFKNQIISIKGPYNMDEDFINLLNNVCNNIANMFDGEDKAKILKFSPIMQEKYPKYFEVHENYKCCMSHGDYRLNNVLVKEKDGVPVEVIAIDYQLIDYGYILRDFMYFIFTGTDRDFRRKHLNDLKDLYFETMSNFLKYFNLDMSDVYPRVKFEEDYRACLDFGLINGFMCSLFAFAVEGLDIDKKSLSELNVSCIDSRYKSRAKGLIDDFTEWGIL